MTSDDSMPIAAGVILGDMTRCIRGFIYFACQSEEHEQGIYYFAIVASACYLESILEESSNLWCKTRASEDQGFQARLMDTIAKDISRATGLDAWTKWLRVLYDIDLPKTIGEDWKALQILFQLRNQLAHGRTSKFTHFWNAQNGRFVGMTLHGSSYELPFRHLIEKDVIRIDTGDVPSSDVLFTCAVVRYFFGVVDRAIAALERIPELSSLRDSTR